MHQIFIPTGDLSRREYWLHHPRSVADLEAMGDALQSGAEIELEGRSGETLQAWLHFHPEVNCWIAYPDRNWAK